VRMVLLVSLHVIIDAQISPIQSRRTSCRGGGTQAPTRPVWRSGAAGRGGAAAPGAPPPRVSVRWRCSCRQPVQEEKSVAAQAADLWCVGCFVVACRRTSLRNEFYPYPCMNFILILVNFILILVFGDREIASFRSDRNVWSIS
jgi:hypothetical protein